ncbi:MAG: hypothetical protein AABZ30_08185 [Myxococcota bacterium]
MMRLTTPLRVGCGSLAAALLVGSSAIAETREATLQKLEQANQQAMSNYDALEFEAAKKDLVGAFEAANAAGVHDDPLVAKLHVSLGVVYVAGLKDPYRGFQEFRRGLQIDPTAQIEPSIATPELQEIFQNARDSLKGEAPKPAPGPILPAEPSLPSIRGLVHTPIDDARAGFPIVVRAEVGEDVGAKKIVLYYRRAGRENFEPEAMIKRGTSWVAQIPGDAVRGRALHYYLEAVDVRSRPVAQNGSAASPNIISLSGGAATVGRAVRRRAEPPPESAEDAREDRRWTLGFSVGTGGGVIGFGSKSQHVGAEIEEDDDEGNFCLFDDDNCEAVEINTGVAVSPLHVGFEIAHQVADLWHVGVLARVQLVSGAQYKQHDAKSFFGELRVKRYLSNDPLRFFVSGGVGGGQVRHMVNLGPDADDRRDTIASGKFALGAGGGINYDFNPGLALVLEANALALMPDDPSVHADVNLGTQFMF